METVADTVWTFVMVAGLFGLVTVFFFTLLHVAEWGMKRYSARRREERRKSNAEFFLHRWDRR